MAPQHAGRLRLLALVVAIIARSAALAVVTVVALNALLSGFDRYRAGTLAAWLGLSALPALILAPFIGPVAGARWNRTVMVAGTLLMVVILAWAALNSDNPWLSIAGVLTLESAFFWIAAITLLPSIAIQVRWPRPGILFLLWFAALGGLAVGLQIALSNAVEPAEAARLGLLASVIGLVGVGISRFHLSEPITLQQGIVRPFLAGARDAVRLGLARFALFGLWLWFFVVLAVLVAVVRFVEPEIDSGTGATTLRFLVALAAGACVSALFRNPYRHGGFILLASLAALVFSLWLRFGQSWSVPFVGLGVALGAVLSPLITVYQTWTTPRYFGAAAALVIAGWCIGALALAVLLVNFGDDPIAARAPFLTILVVLTAIGFLGALMAFVRPALELVAEMLITPFYRMEVVGPGVSSLPARGSCLVIANHAAWFDPLFVAKVVPAPITPMMTSRFYDLPVLSWIMRNIIGTIRVPEKQLRHEAPELKEAVAALDRGECVALFPEGYLRRKEEQPIRRFGRGVWQILYDRPDTPVFACWIDGNWGSYFSYKGGPPTKNKRFDFWRRIRIAVTGPIKVDPILLKDHMATRTFLMQKVSAARQPLGLEPLTIENAPDEEKE